MAATGTKFQASTFVCDCQSPEQRHPRRLLL